MSMTETYKSLDKPATASSPASMTSITIDTAQVVEALGRANINTAQELAAHLKPVGTALAALAEAANRATAEFMTTMRSVKEDLSSTE